MGKVYGMMRGVTPRDLYATRLKERRYAVAALKKRELTMSVARVIVAAIAVVIAFLLTPYALIPVAIFIVLAIAHERMIRARRRLEEGAAFYDRGIARIDGTWAGGGDRGDEFADDHHPYASDFDLFGNGSLFELISLAVTRGGRRLLAAWLKSPSMDAHEIRARQAAVNELRDNVDLREDLATGAVNVSLAEWASMSRIETTRIERIASIVLPAIAVVIVGFTIPSLIARYRGEPPAFPLWPLIAISLVIAAVSRGLKPRIEQIIAGVERAEPALALLGGMLVRLEREPFRSEKLAGLLARIRGAHVEIESLRKRVALLDARRNQFFAPIAALLMWTANVAFAIERWRAKNGPSVIDWIDVIAECEALSSLASFAFEHPAFAMPEIAGQAGLPVLHARDLGHPLIPGDRRITNDLRLDDTQRLLMVSGSNMSGKSTMLRSAGIAAVLAMTGAPVCARSLTIAPMAVGASIRIHDSLQENASRFYAEILRIRQVLEMSQQGPLLFLLDEMLAGTNSHDRRIGAEAIVRALVNRGAIGLVSTHDLALAEIANMPNAANVHFEDHLEEGKVVFDYRMREGVVTKSNALELMRSVGIDV